MGRGPLGDSEEHLEEKCQQQKVECPNRCGEKKERELLQNYTEHDCPNRRYTCPHCDHVGVYKDVTTVHFTNCRDFPFLCPAGCGEKITRKNMESHLNTECPEEYVLYKFKCLTVTQLLGGEKRRVTSQTPASTWRSQWSHNYFFSNLLVHGCNL